MLRFFGWGSGNKTSRPDNLDDELNSNLTLTRTASSRSAYRTPPSQISISAPIPRNPAATSFGGGLDNPYIAGSQANGSSSDLRHYRHPNTSLTRVGGSTNNNNPAAASPTTSLGRVPVSYKSPQQPYIPYHLPSPPLSDGGSDVASFTGMADGPPPAVIRIETSARLPARRTLQPSPTRGSSPTVTPTATQPGFAAPVAPTPMRRTASSPPSSTSPYHSSPGEESSPSSSELTHTFPVGSASGSGNGANAGGKWNLKLHTSNPIYSQSTQSLPGSSSLGASQFHSPGMYSDPALAYSEVMPDPMAYTYPYPLVKQLSPIAEQDYMSPDSMKRSMSLPPSNCASRVGSEQDMRGSELSRGGSLTQSVSPGGSQTSEFARPSPSCHAAPFINRPLNRTASQGSSRTTSSVAGPRSTRSDSQPNPKAPSIPPLDLRTSLIGGHSGSMQTSPTGSGRIRSSKFSNFMPSIVGSTDGCDDDGFYATADRESLHADAESFVTATGDDDHHRRGNSTREIETVDKEFTPRFEPAGPAVPEAASARESVVSRTMLPSASESWITRRWDRDVGLAPGVTPTFRAKKQWIDVTPAFWAFWFGFLCPFLWLVGGWHFTHFGEQPPRLSYWEFYFTGFWKGLSCCGSRKGSEGDEMSTTRREGKQTAREPPPLPRWVAEKQSSELGRARLNDPKRSLKGISFGYPFITRPMPPKPEDETVFKKMVKRMLEIMDKPNRVFDQLYGIRLREVRGRPESGRRMFDPWIQRCRYALCYAMLLLAIGLLVASAYLIVYNTRQL